MEYKRQLERHLRYAQFCRTVDFLLQLPGMIFAGLNVTSSAAGWNRATFILSCATAVCQGMSAMLNYRQLAEQHETVAAKYKKVVRFLRAEKIMNEGRTSHFYPYEPLHAHGENIQPDQPLTLETPEEYKRYLLAYIEHALDFQDLYIPSFI